MAYRIQIAAPLDEEARRILIEQIERAEKRLRSGEDRATAVHEARKHFKRVRALLRLLRPAIGKEAFARENADFRETALLLAGARDAHVLGLTLARLETEHTLDPKRHTAGTRRAIAELPDVLDAAPDSAPIRGALRRLEAARARMSALKIDAKDFAVAAAGLKRCYREALDARAAALADGSDEAYHEWRKRVQQHWRQMGLLAKAWPDYFNARIHAAKRLATKLGDDHDLAVLIAFIQRQPAGAIGAAERRKLVKLARKSQAALRQSSTLDAERLFADSPKGLTRRVEAYWQAACSAALAGNAASEGEGA